MFIFRINIFLVFFLGSLYSFNENGKQKSGYNDVSVCGENFIAVGTGGRIDIISITGEITPLKGYTNINLNSVICVNNKVIAVGDKGTILISDDTKEFTKAESGTEKDINSVTFLHDFVIAAADNGIILVSDDTNEWKEIPLPVKGDIVSVSSDKSRCFGVTNESEIISSTDAITWNVFDYNQQYKGFNKSCIFKNVHVSNNRIAIVGKHTDNSPVALFSAQGNVWTERSLNYTDGFGSFHVFTNIPNDVAYDPVENQFFIVCYNGEVSILSSCTKCNKAHTLSERNLNAIAYLNNFLMIVGEGFSVYPVKLR